MATDKSALVVRGGWEGHAPVESTEMFIPFLEAHGYDIRVEVDPRVYADSAYMDSVDLIMQCYTMGDVTPESVQGLRTAIAKGAGMAGWHGGIADSYRQNAEYLQLIGGQFACHPGKHPNDSIGDQSDNYLRYTVNIVPEHASHPIVAGIGDFELETEQYWVLSDDYCDVLATTTHPAPPWRPWHREITCPAIWTRLWGDGRIFVATPGHQPDVLRDPNVHTIIERGLLWASR